MKNNKEKAIEWAEKELAKHEKSLKNVLAEDFKNYLLFGESKYINEELVNEILNYSNKDIPGVGGTPFQTNLNKGFFHEMIPCEILVGSLILSPLNSKEENTEMFNNWIRENYND